MFNEDAVISQWVADMYDQNETQTDDVDFLLSVIGQQPKRILEIACGSGRILVPLAMAGHCVTGLDFDECMLARILPKAKGLKNIAWCKADVIRDDWGSDFDAVVLAGNILFNIISDMDYEEAQRLLVQKASAALVPGGHIYIDYGYTLHPENWFGDPSERVIWEGADSSGNYGRMVLSGSTFNAASGITRSTRKFELTLASGETIVQTIPCMKRFATLEQIHRWLDSAGCAVEAEYGNYRRDAIGENTGRAIIWARKR